MALDSPDSRARLSSLIELLKTRAAQQPDRQAHTFLTGEASSVTVTYGGLDRKARAIAAWLGERVRPRDRVLLLYPPGPDFVASFFGCLYAGVISAPLPLPGARSGLEKLQLVQADTGAALALTTSALLEERLGGGGLPGLRLQATDSIDDALAGDWVEPDGGPGALAYLQYTSGSTSTPRGVMVGHDNVLHNLANIDGGFGHSPESVLVTWLPHFHDMGLIYGLLAPVFGGFPGYVMSPAAFVQRPILWLQAITKFKATHSGGPNFAYDLCVRRISPEDRAGLDLSSWEVAFNGAEPVHSETLDRFVAAFEPCGFRRSALDPAYGLAEAGLKVSGGLKDQPPVIFPAKASSLAQNRVEPAEEGSADTRVMVSCGRAGLDTKLAIVDPETLSRCAPGEVGEIWVAGPGVAQGYWRRPEDTEQTFGARLGDTGEGPFLRSGDLGFLRDDQLFVAGRLKDLIIIRGLNHHPSDIEITARRAHPELAASIGAAFPVEVAGDERLALVMEAGRREPSDVEEIARAVRQAVSERHEVQVYALVLVAKGGVPKTSSGKIQRRRCRSLYLGKKLDVVYESILEQSDSQEVFPALDREALLASRPEDRGPLVVSYLRSRLARALKTRPQEFDPARPVTSYGVDSLTAMELQNRVELDLGVPLPAVALLEGASIDGLAAHIVEGLADKLRAVGPIPARGERESPLSFEQERLWLLDQISPGNAAYHIPFALRMKGPLDVAALERSVNEVLKRHESLRTSFATSNGTPVCVVAPPAEMKIPVEEAGDAAEAVRLATIEARKPFDLSKGPLFRMRLYRLGERDHLALLVMHHIVSDVWSVRLFLEEVVALYLKQPLEPLPVQYGDFAAWQREQLRGETLERLRAYWRQRLEGAPTLQLPTERPRPKTPSFQGASESFTLPPELAESLRGFCQKESATLFTVLLAAFKVLLARSTNQTDLVIGTTSANRNRPELERLIGFFAAPLVVRTELSGDPKFREVVERVRKEVLAAYAHQDLPFAKVVEVAHPGRHTGYTPLFRVMFSVVKSLLPEAELPEMAVAPVAIDPGATDFDLFVNIVEEPDELRGFVSYNKDLYDPETIRTLIDSYLQVLETAAGSPETTVSRFPVAETLAAPAEAGPSIAVAATFTAEPVEEIVAFWMRELGFGYRIEFAPYNQVFQQLLDASSLVGANSNGVNVVLVRIEDWAQPGTAADPGEMEEDVRGFISSLKTASERAASPFLVYLCPASIEFLEDAERAAFETRMESLIEGAFDSAGPVHVVKSAEIESLYPVRDYHDSHGDRLGHVPYTSEFFAALGTVVARKIHAMRTAPFKVIVLDCDQTLWNGVCGEDGPEGVAIDPPRRALQQFMAEQHDAGMLLAIASKNNEEDVLDTFAAHPEMPLRREHFVSMRINWGPKSGNLRDLAAELRLGLDSFIFVDDSPTECAEVEASCPEVLTLQLPADAARIPRFLEHTWAFDHLRATEEDKKRTAMYGQRLERRKLQHRVATLEEFLAALELQIRFAEMTPAQLPRVSQLTRRTNQMNLTTVRRSEGEIQELLRHGAAECLTVDVKDRFGSYGLVGVVLFASNEENLEVDTLLLSCRALGRGVEHRMIARLGEIAVERGLRNVNARLIRTAKNLPALDFLRSVGSRYEESIENGFLYRLPAEHAVSVTYNPRSEPGEPVTDNAAPRLADRAARSADYHLIATELDDAGRILERVRAEGRSDAASTIPYQAPRTPLEGRLVGIWAEMLSVPKVGVNDNFFDLGGHSLLAVQLLSRVRETLNVDLALDVVFTGNFSVAELAKAIEVHEIEQAGAGEYAAILEELEGLSDEEVRALIKQEEEARGSGDS